MAVCVAALALATAGEARADGAAPVALAAPATALHGVIVVAGSEDAGPAAHALAHDVYRDPTLRPTIDDAIARVLAGEAPEETASPKIKEIAEARTAAAKAPTDVASRRLFASFGAELGAQLVVVVTVESGRPIARVMRTPASTFDRVEMGATIEKADPATPAAAPTVRWPGAAMLLRGIATPPVVRLPPAAAAPVVAAPKPVGDAPADKPIWKSGWFWASLGGVAAVGLTVFAISRATDSSAVHLTGHVSP